ncbi:MAG TPA: glycine/sarcosine/betaine reductase selenoprotein B family protein [Thermomicrobiales bacterium]|nr:glycine/sarcosine/betaine reductase selenoprotein B family protein [Thermomicrobiales bacterium]
MAQEPHHSEVNDSERGGVNFADIERSWVQGRLYPDFGWRAFDRFSPVNPMRVPLEESRVAFVTTAGAHLADQPPFNLGTTGDPSFRAFASNTPLDDLVLTHGGYNTRRTTEDKNAVLLLDHLRHAAATGVIGSLAATVYSFMGYVANTAPLMQESGPAVARRLIDDQVDLVLLAPT